MYDLNKFTLADMVRCGAELRKCGSEAKNMEQVALRIVRHLYETLGDSNSGQRSCVLVRFFKTHPYSALGPNLQQFGQSMAPDVSLDWSAKCLTLLATTGDRPEWKDPDQSRGHRVIPLVSKHAVEQIPMLSRLIQQFGIDVDTLLASKDEIITEMDRKIYNVFHVQSARGSPYIPAQENFVIPYNIESVLGSVEYCPRAICLP